MTKSKMINKILSSDLEEVLAERKETGLSSAKKKMVKGRSDMTDENNQNSHIKVSNTKQRPFFKK
jgi:hypothetical protein